jgi:hypothetical protein
MLPGTVAVDLCSTSGSRFLVQCIGLGSFVIVGLEGGVPMTIRIDPYTHPPYWQRPVFWGGVGVFLVVGYTVLGQVVPTGCLWVFH